MMCIFFILLSCYLVTLCPPFFFLLQVVNWVDCAGIGEKKASQLRHVFYDPIRVTESSLEVESEDKEDVENREYAEDKEDA